ncbi:MAG: alpha-glucosidase/alpha-galactosidase [Oscillospiraceae bacterium]|nr:alpha-glucosidase/alpha-galactosidase [Oscillospiraceae bacterium]
MPKITFMGAGSTIFARNVLGDSMLAPSLQNADIALFDIDPVRLKDSETILSAINGTCNENRAKITSYTDRLAALDGADFVVNAIQVGGYEPSTVIDFDIPKKYGLRQTIADTLGIGGIFRTLRTLPVFQDFAEDMEKACPDAWFLNYTNPMAMLTGFMQRYTPIKTVGLCHSVQWCAEGLLQSLGMPNDNVQSKIAGINHQGWLLEMKRNGEDLYPEARKRAAEKNASGEKHHDMVRFEMMKWFGYYVTESSEHMSEYLPYFIKEKYPELIERFNIPLDEYPRRCVNQIAGWNELRDRLVNDKNLTHTRSGEYASYIMEAMVENKPYKIGGNVLNTGLITNLPSNACVEVPCLVDASGVNGCYVGDLPEQLAAINRTNINPQLMTIEAHVSKRKDAIYQAAMLDPHTSAELSIDDIVAMCDDLIEAHGLLGKGGYLPSYS